MKSIAGMSVLITGGGSGIGRDCARRFCERGARVTISGRRMDKLQAVQAELGKACHELIGLLSADEEGSSPPRPDAEADLTAEADVG